MREWKGEISESRSGVSEEEEEEEVSTGFEYAANALGMSLILSGTRPYTVNTIHGRPKREGIADGPTDRLKLDRMRKLNKAVYTA